MTACGPSHSIHSQDCDLSLDRCAPRVFKRDVILQMLHLGQTRVGESVLPKATQ